MTDHQLTTASSAMPYRASWRLLGAGERLLDRGYLDGVHESHDAACAEIMLQLQQFAVSGRHEHRKEWWARRTPDADIEMRFRVEERGSTLR
jgi:hypothetical protein